MDSLISAAARALAAGDALAALQRVALRDDPPALALRGIAMAQLGEHPRARDLLRRAARGFGTHEPVARARCVVAEAEVALAQRDLGGRAQALMSAGATLQAHGDIANALQARLVAARTLILLGAAALLSGCATGEPDRMPRPMARGSDGAAAIWASLGSLACTRWKWCTRARLAWPLPQPTSQARSWCRHWSDSQANRPGG